MEKKYELVKDDSIIIGSSWLYRIRALKNIQTSALGIRSGDLGGYVESEKNLSQDGTCWVHGNAMVYEEAIVFENAIVADNAIVRGSAHIYGDSVVKSRSNVRDFAKIHEDVLISGDSIISDYAEVYGESVVKEHAYVSGHSSVCEDAVISGNADVHGNAQICGTVYLNGNAKISLIGLIKDNSDYACVSGFGSINRTTTFYLSVDRKTILVNCGCFEGTINEFRKRVNQTYPDDEIGQEYLDLADLMEKRFSRIVKRRKKIDENLKKKEELVTNQFMSAV